MKQYKVENLAENEHKKGCYFMDYSKKYQEPYNVLEKARKHMISYKKREFKECDKSKI